jgi:lipoprotein NlpD
VDDRPVRDEPAAASTVSGAAAASKPNSTAPSGATASKANSTAAAAKGTSTKGAAADTSPKGGKVEASKAVTASKREALEGDWRPETYTVKKGDTLYSIALDHGLDYRELDAWNGLSDPNVIRVGQELKLRPPAGWKQQAETGGDVVVARSAAATPAIEGTLLDGPVPVKAGPKALKLAYSDRALAQLRGLPAKPAVGEASPIDVANTPPATGGAPKSATASVSPGSTVPAKPAPATSEAKSAVAPGEAKAGTAVAAGDQGITWVWPTRGKLLHAFSEGLNPKGVAIGGESGQAVMASAAGKVVYSGSGLRGYGKLIIIKHSDTYLSVYAHNRQLLVKEGERVARGQKIAEMGDSDSDRIALHFEIRRLGKPVDPLKYLPEEGAS